MPTIHKEERSLNTFEKLLIKLYFYFRIKELRLHIFLISLISFLYIDVLFRISSGFMQLLLLIPLIILAAAAGFNCLLLIIFYRKKIRSSSVVLVGSLFFAFYLSMMIPVSNLFLVSLRDFFFIFYVIGFFSLFFILPEEKTEPFTVKKVKKVLSKLSLRKNKK